MKLILFIILMWLLIRILRRGRTRYPTGGYAQGRPYPLPEPGRDDASLPGPLGRPIPAEVRSTGGVTVEEDVPLTDPWSRPVPPEAKKQKPGVEESASRGNKDGIYPAAERDIKAACSTDERKRKYRCRHKHPAAALFDRQSLVNGIIMAEILGPPGGHRRRKGLGKTVVR